MITTTKFNNNRPIFNVGKLTFGQKRYVNQTIKLWSEMPEHSSGSFNLAVIMWGKPGDYYSTMQEAEDPIEGEKEYHKFWARHRSMPDPVREGGIAIDIMPLAFFPFNTSEFEEGA